MTGDALADAIVVTENGITIRRSNGQYFKPEESGFANRFYGSRGTFFADVTGDGLGDPIAVTENEIAVLVNSVAHQLPLSFESF